MKVLLTYSGILATLFKTRVVVWLNANRKESKFERNYYEVGTEKQSLVTYLLK